MRGDCGVFYVDGKQVGGCHKWRLLMKTATGVNGKWQTVRVLNTKAVVSKWWFMEKVKDFKMCLYWVRDGDLVSAGEYEIKDSRLPTSLSLNAIQVGELRLMF